MTPLFRTTLALLILLGPALAQAGEPARPMSEMQGGCDNYLTDLRGDLALWARPSQPVRSAVSADLAPRAPLEQRLTVSLQPHPEVTFPAPPEQMRGAPDRFSGLVRIHSARAGSYRLSASSGLWLDVARGQALIPSRRFEMQTACATIFKTVTYDLPADTDLIVQINGGKTDSVDILIHRIEGVQP